MGAEHGGHRPIFFIQGIDLGGDGAALTRETIHSPVAVGDFLARIGRMYRIVLGMEDQAVSVQRHGDWRYCALEDPATGVNHIVAILRGHWGVLSVRCMRGDIPFVLENTLVADSLPP